jgi:hypothetical protein
MPTGEALAALLRELRARFPTDADTREVEIWLASLGYDARQIGDVLVALASHDAGGGSGAEPPPRPAPGPAPVDPAWPPLRVAAPYERARFSPEAWGHLLQLRAAGLDGLDFEQLVDRVLLNTEGRIGLEEVEAIAEGLSAHEPSAPAGDTVH